MAATMRTSNDPANTVTVRKVVTVKSDVDKLFFAKYLLISYQLPGFDRFARKIAYRVRALIV